MINLKDKSKSNLLLKINQLSKNLRLRNEINY